MSRYVYLAGPIANQTEKEAKTWRAQADDFFRAVGSIKGISPLRTAPPEPGVYKQSYLEDVWGQPRGVIEKNLFDVRNCDMVLAYLPQPAHIHGQPSLGTISEIAWAKVLGKPVVLASNWPYVTKNMVVSQSCGWIVPTLEEACEICVGILDGYTGGKNV